MRLPTLIPPQYNDGSNLSRELFTTVKLIDAIVEFQESITMHPDYIPACITKTLQYCNNRSQDIMARMDDIDYPASKLPSAIPDSFVEVNHDASCPRRVSVMRKCTCGASKPETGFVADEAWSQ